MRQLKSGGSKGYISDKFAHGLGVRDLRYKDKSLGPYRRIENKSLGPYRGIKDKSLGPYRIIENKSLGPYRRIKDKSLGPYQKRIGQVIGFKVRYL